MSKIKIEKENDIAIMRMVNGTTNAINPELIHDMRAAIKEIENESRGMVLAGNKHFFAIGFDVPTLLKLDRSGMEDFFNDFNQLTLDLFTLPIPTACAIAGHAIGGGNILALTQDYRFMTQGKKLIGLNEIQLGIPIPYLADLILRHIIGHSAAKDMIYSGRLMPAKDGKEIGVIDEVTSEEDVEAKAIEKIASIIKFPSKGFAAVKKNHTDIVQRVYEADLVQKNREFIDCWFSPEVQELLIKAAEKF